MIYYSTNHQILNFPYKDGLLLNEPPNQPWNSDFLLNKPLTDHDHVLLY